MPLHIRADPNDIAARVLLVGDPGRARRIAERLDGAHCYNEHRGLLGYTGTYRDTRISVQTTGMGGPSAAIAVEELATLGAQVVIRAGTCGAIAGPLDVLDLVIATGAVPLDGTTRAYAGGAPFAPVADHEVVGALRTAAGAVARSAHVGLLASHDAFYLEHEDRVAWAERGVLALEMEAAAVFTVALRRRLRAGVVCLVVDRVGERDSWASDEAVAEATGDLIAVAIEAAAVLEVE